MAVVLETTVGDMTIDLLIKERPLTCKNFLNLCKLKYYNFNLFYSIQNNFIAQTGDPTGTGSGGASAFSFVKGPEAKFITGEKYPRLKHTKPGHVSMVNCGNYLIGSQFFITLKNDLDSLDEHIIFGEIVEGFEVLSILNETVCDIDNRPYKDIRITHTVILDDPFDDIEGLIFPPFSPEPTEEILETNRIGADEDINDAANCSVAELEELKAQQEAKARATVLEIVGDIPDKDIAPPENVLFVCKLNPVTTDEDLEMIFSRFGKINSCEVIKDQKTGNSLQYAFIEFDNKNSCENAYFKMDNVLIDDRRIHVDFSQSVSKMRWRGKGRGVEYLNEDRRTNFPDTGSKGNRNYSSKRLKKNNDNDNRKYNFKNSQSRERSRSRTKYKSNNSRNRSNSRSAYRTKCKSKYSRSRSNSRLRSRTKYRSKNLRSRSIDHYRSKGKHSSKTEAKHK